MRNLVSLLIIGIVAVSCGTGGNREQKVKPVTITAAGATFPQPFYNLAFKKYNEEGGPVVNYGGIGSGGGIKSLADRIVDFGATDAYLSDEELASMPAEIVHIPTCIGAVAIGYNLPGVSGLRLTPELLSGIFLGKITRWDDAAIATENPGVSLPDMNITVVYRSDGSGTTYIFSDYMSKVSSEWSSTLGTGKSLNWPAGIGAKGNPGVAGTLAQGQGSIGYIGYEYAVIQKIPMALIRNSSGVYVEPTLASFSAAAATEIPADTRVMITNSDSPDAYPISSFTWIILYREQSYNDRDAARAATSVNTVRWLTGQGAQAIATSVNYAPLPQNVIDKATAILNSVTFNGQPL